jgi:hypothetical protein
MKKQKQKSTGMYTIFIYVYGMKTGMLKFTINIDASGFIIITSIYLLKVRMFKTSVGNRIYLLLYKEETCSLK